MKVSNFKLIEILGDNLINLRFRGTVDVTTGLFKKKTVTKEIFREYGGYWYFVDTGKFTPGMQVEYLVRSFEAKCGKKLQNLKELTE